MTRTIVNLDDDDKRWLHRQAEREGVPMTELVRRAVHWYRLRAESLGRRDITTLLEQTAGIWPRGDGLRYQRALREEWDREE